MSSSPAPDPSIPQARTKEENQERAFIAASRRKDRSLDARIESANRASILHKRRTGRSLAIDREVVSKELMYEEIDDKYDAKRQRFFHLQNAQMSHDFDNILRAAFPNAPHGSQLQMPAQSPQIPNYSPQGQSPQPGVIPPQGSPTAQRWSVPRRPTVHHSPYSLSPNRPIHGARNMSIDLSGLRNTLPGPRTDSSAAMNFSPSYLTPSQAQVQTHAQAQVPSYLASDPFQYHQGHQNMMQTWSSVFGDPTMSPNAKPWQAHAQHWPNNQFRNRIASAPIIPQTTTPAQAASQITTQVPVAAPVRGTQHMRIKSEPGPGLAAAPVPVPVPVPTRTPSPSIKVTPSVCDSRSTSPPTPVSPTSGTQATVVKMSDSLESTGGLHGLPTTANLEAPDEAFKYTPPELQGFSFNVGTALMDQSLPDHDLLEFAQYASGLHNDQAQALPFPMPMADSDMGGLPVDATFEPTEMTADFATS